MRAREQLTAAILAAGAGRRMKALGSRSLLEVGRQTLVSRQVEAVRAAFPGCDVLLVGGFDADRTAAALPEGVRFVENEAHAETNAARSLEIALRASVCRRLLVLHGDLVFASDVLAGLDPSRSAALVDSAGQMAKGEVGCVVQGGEVTNFSYGLPAKWAQVAYLRGKELSLLRLCLGKKSRKHMVFEALNAVIERGGRLRAFCPPRLRIAEIDSAADVDAARKMF